MKRLEELRLAAETDNDARQAGDGRPTWWVNQGKTYSAESSGGYVWAPVVGRGGHALGHHTAVGEMRPGDVVLHYANSAVRAIGVVEAMPERRQRPSELPDDWGQDGHFCRVRYFGLAPPIRFDELPDPPRSVGPFDSHGGVKQGYLFPLPNAYAAKLGQS